jgi:PadR family transcriptional regulator PadR
MLKEGWLKAAWSVSATNRRIRIYSVTPSGLRHLERETSSFERMLEGIRRVLTTAAS